MQPTGSKKWLTLALLVALLWGCGALVLPGRELPLTSTDFHQRLRWQDYQGAARHLTDKHRPEFLSHFKSREDLHIVDVRLDTMEYVDGATTAVTETVLEYYQLPSVTVKKHRFRQQWEYQGGDRYHPGTWRIISPFPVFP